MTPSGKKPKARKPHFYYHIPPKERKTSTNHRYIQYSTNAGLASVSTSSIQTPVLHQPEDEILLEQNQEPTDIHAISGDDNTTSIDLAYLTHVEEQESFEAVEKLKRVRSKGDQALRDWEAQVDLFAQEIIGHDGRSDWASGNCAMCDVGQGEYECRTCGDRLLVCGNCMVASHVKFHLHCICKWNGIHFQKSSLRELGLRKQLNHPPGERCLNPIRCAEDEFCVIDISGIHNIAVDFCGCGKEDQRYTIQLLRSRLYPATVAQPHSAATFEVLKLFEILSYESKSSAFEMYQTLSRLTDNTGTDKPKDRYLSFIRMAREWRHLKMVIRAGRAHDPAGIAATAEGECAVLCPACPHPGINMGDGWEQVPDDKKFLHAKFIALDANFRLKRKNVSTQSADPGLSKGWAYFVEETGYKSHLDSYKHEREPKSTCSRHDAVNLSNAKPNRGHAASGIGKVVCARHDMNLPNSVGDLQLGERYCNMDYIFHKAVNTSRNPVSVMELISYVISYDIACQWSRNFRDRMFALDPEFFLLDGRRYIKFLVPKFHLPAHISACRTNYSFNLTPGVGRTDGEAPERTWNETNPLATSTREMGPGSRRDVLDYHFGDHNWRKVIGLGVSVKKKVRAAALNMAEHVVGHEDFCSTIPEKSLAIWTEEIESWEKDSTKPNPFDQNFEGPSQAAVRRQLAEDEARSIAEGRDFALDDKVSPSILISSGIDLEAEQRALRREASKLWQHAQDRQKTKVQLRSNALQRKIDAWVKYQALYCPRVELLRTNAINESNRQTDLKPYDYPLWLPSQIEHQAHVPKLLQQIEWKLRYAQAHEALRDLRHQLQLRAYLYKFKDRWVRGQGANTRTRNTISGIEARMDAAAEEYRNSFHALQLLAPILLEFQWKDELLPLMPEDIRDLSEGKAGVSEGKRTISWIWRTGSVGVSAKLDGGSSDEDLLDRVRIEFAKSRARGNRFAEEVELGSEEMTRILKFFAYKAQEWTTRAETTPETLTKSRAEGHKAYAHRQASIYLNLRARCATLWSDVPAYINRMREIIENPQLAKPGEFDGTRTSSENQTFETGGSMDVDLEVI